MKKSILEAFAYGELVPFAGLKNESYEYEKARASFFNHEEKLMSMLTDESKEVFKKFTNALIEMQAIDNIDHFIYGYRLGVLMTTEVYAGIDFSARGRVNQ